MLKHTTKALLTIGTAILVFHTLNAEKLRLVPTFENCSVYVEETKSTPAELKVEYRQKGTEQWLEGHKLVNSSNNPAPRTSLFHLTADTEYEVRCLKDGQPVATSTVKTWSDNVPIAKTIVLKDVNPKGEPWLIDQSGTAQGWIKYVGSPGYVLNGGDKDNEAILIENASYVIVENLTVVGGKRHGFLVKKSNHIRIRNCDISGFGRKGEKRSDGKWYAPGDKKAINWDAGVHLDDAEQLVVENCYIHDPRNTANSWTYGHPLGPNAMFIKAGPKGGLVVRYNDFIGSLAHRWNDVVESYGNSKPHGGFRCDSDIYGNFLAFPNDDGIELEGGQQNIRFYGNKIEGGLCGISTAANLIGPSFIFNNLVVNLGDERGSASAVVKNGGGSSYTKGITHFYNNTFYTFGRGITGVGLGKDKNKQMFFGVSRNNIIATSCSGIADGYTPPECNYDYDLFYGLNAAKGSFYTKRPMEQNAIFADPKFVNPKAGDFQLQAGSSAVKAGTKVAGFTTTDKPDMGALASNGKYAFMPWRTLGLSADKYQIRFKLIAGATEAPEQTVTIDTSKLKAPQPYRIAKNKVSNWLKVTPAEGILQPGTKTQLKVTVDRNILTSGKKQGVFLVRLNSGQSLPVTVYADVLNVDFKQLYLATNCEGAATFKRETVDGMDCLNFSEHKEEGITIKPNIPAAGGYYLYLQVKCPQPFPLHDSVFIGVNGSELERCGVTPGGSWHWVAKPGKVSTIQLKQGENAIKVCQREELYLRAVYLSSQPLFPGDDIDIPPVNAEKKDEQN